MSYYKVSSIDLRDENNIHVTGASSNCTPTIYERISYTGTIEDLFQDLLGGNLQINQGNRQQVHAAVLQARIYLRSKNVDTFDLYMDGYKSDEYKQAFKIFKQLLSDKPNPRKYYITLEGRNFHKWTKYGYKYNLGGHEPRSFHDLLIAQANYTDVNYVEA